MRFKIIFRYFYAALIGIVSTLLIWTTLVKTYEAFTAHQVTPQYTHLASTPLKELRLVSNNQKPDEKIFITLPNQGYIFTISCEHYMNSLCTNADNQHYLRQIKTLDLVHYGKYHYIQNIKYQNTQNLETKSFHFDNQQIHQFYTTDIESLKFQLILLWFFSLFALYVCIRIVRDFQTFLNK
ncbi:hypothetical protein HX127_00515 [Acinetobacter sp. 256-1]|uniref:hypothetical protein n=1 Tax=Acinetobacter sp. 256-1 TaxID=2746721 RepID=UPI002577F2F7|nr:hypothetical protein [Acinetobacter sp. 256-1]MDM1756066.1 hypothetical protein [Acinetobacter sp. 256-1]